LATNAKHGKHDLTTGGTAARNESLATCRESPTLRLLEQQAAEDAKKIVTLRALAVQAIDELDRGLGVELKDRSDLKKHVASLGRRAAKRAGRIARAE
jgi:hypothetical protein